MPRKMNYVAFRIGFARALAFASMLICGHALATVDAQAQIQTPTLIPGRPIVYASYMHSYILGAAVADPVRARGIVRDHLEDFDKWPENEISERSWWSARLAPLATSGLEGTKLDLAMAHAAGIDALAVLMGNLALPKSQFSAGLELVAQAAATSSVKIFPDLWDNFDLIHPPGAADIAQYGAAVKALMDKYPNAFLRIDGKLAISLGNTIQGRATSKVFPWKDFRHFFDPWGGSDSFYMIADVPWQTNLIAPDWRNALSAFSFWAPELSWGDHQLDALAALGNATGKAISWPVITTYYGGRRGTESMSEALGVSRYIDQWRAAIKLHTPLIQIQTWNDFSEDHAITETNYRGESLIELTKYLSDWAHSGKPPAVSQEKLFLFHHRQLVNAALTAATIHAHDDAFHMTPSTDYLDVVSILARPGTLELTVGTQTWRADVPAGLHQWLLFVPSARKEPGPMREAFTRPEGSYPISDPDRTVQTLHAMPQGTPTVALLRSDQKIGALTSRSPIVVSGKWQDLSLVGDVLDLPN